MLTAFDETATEVKDTTEDKKGGLVPETFEPWMLDPSGAQQRLLARVDDQSTLAYLAERDWKDGNEVTAEMGIDAMAGIAKAEASSKGVRDNGGRSSALSRFPAPPPPKENGEKKERTAREKDRASKMAFSKEKRKGAGMLEGVYARERRWWHGRIWATSLATAFVAAVLWMFPPDAGGELTEVLFLLVAMPIITWVTIPKAKHYFWNRKRREGNEEAMSIAVQLAPVGVARARQSAAQILYEKEVDPTEADREETIARDFGENYRSERIGAWCKMLTEKPHSEYGTGENEVPIPSGPPFFSMGTSLLNWVRVADAASVFIPPIIFWLALGAFLSGSFVRSGIGALEAVTGLVALLRIFGTALPVLVISQWASSNTKNGRKFFKAVAAGRGYFWEDPRSASVKEMF